MRRKKILYSILRILTTTTSLISGCLVLFILLLSIFNGCLLTNCSTALVEIEKYERGQIPLEALDSNVQTELDYYNSDPEKYREYIVETKSFLSYLAKLLISFTFIFCASLYLRKKAGLLSMD